MTYTRPALNLGEYLDESGAPIPYGRRWGMGSPAEDSYSVTRHPERFAPLVDVALAIREHLVATYDVTVDGDRLVPSDPAAPTLTITVTDFPQVRLAAGIAGTSGGPQCGCDACDEDVVETAQELENFAFAVAEGRFEETFEGKVIWSNWSYPEGSRGSGGSRKDYDKDEIKAFRKRGQWKPWPLREASVEG